MRPLEDFFPKVLRYAPGVAEPALEDALREAAIMVCEKTRCWREAQTFDTIGDEAEIVCVPPDAAIFEIDEAWFEGKRLARMAFDAINPQDWPEYQPGVIPPDGIMPVAVSQVTPGTITVVPGARGKLTLALFLKPATDAQMLADVLFDRFATLVADGAAARLLTIPNTQYFNPQLAQALAANFQSVCDANFRFQKRGEQRAPTRTRGHYV